jgi:CheY-like chemotaxis protein
LPGIDGYELARRVRAHDTASTLTLVALTGYGLPVQREKALSAGFDLHLVKPVDPEVLASVLAEPQKQIARFSDRRRAEEQAPSPDLQESSPSRSTPT